MTWRVPAVTFRVDEGRLLSLLDILLGRRVDGIPWSPVEVVPDASLLAAGRERIARAALRYLTEAGGYRERVFLREGRRVRGRVWDAVLAEGFTVRFTTASRELWIRGASHLPTLASPDATMDVPRRRRLIREMVAIAETASGDWIFYAIVRDALRHFRLPEADLREIVHRLSLGSPLVTLFAAQAMDSDEVLRSHLAPLLASSHVRMVECLESRLATAWLSQARVDWRLSLGELLRRWHALGRCLHGWLDVIDAARRTDLARPLLTFSACLATEVFAGGSEAARVMVGDAPGVRSVDDREKLLAAVASVASLGPRLLRLRDRLALERYGDERYEEGQIYVGEADRVLLPVRRPVEALAHALVGALG